MKKYSALILSILFSAISFAQIEQMRTPLSPAFTILDQTPTTIERPSSVQALSSNIQSAFAYGKFKPGVGLEITPFWMMLKKNYDVKDYLKEEVNKGNYGKLFLHHLSFSAATSSTDTFVIGHISPGLGCSYGVRFLLFPGNISKKTVAKIEAVQAKISDKAEVQAILKTLTNDIVNKSEPEATLDVARIKVLTTNAFAGAHPDVAAELNNFIDGENASAFTKKVSAIKLINQFKADKLVSLEKDAVELSNHLSSAREGFMWEVGAAGLSVFEQNKFSSAYFAKAQIWSTLSYRIVPDPDNQKRSIDFMMLFRGTINDKVVDTSNYFDYGVKAQWNEKKWNLSLEFVARFASKPTIVPDSVSMVKPKNYTYRLVANFDYKINDLLGLNISFGKAFDGMSTTFDKKKEQSIIASGGLNIGIGKKDTK